ncbi:MAG TPA: hypothetical protein VFE29_05055 [Terriglobia bacterium]|nr:hypothetical protein [Terriglobia bacterium]
MNEIRHGRFFRSGTRVVAALALALSLLLPAVPASTASDTLPAAISDEDFWKMIETFSEDGGWFSSENFSSNELGYQTLIPKLQAIVKPGGVYLGVGPEQNFQYIASLKPKIAFIIDIRRQNLVQHLMYKAAFELSANRADFLSIVFSRARPEGMTDTSTPEQLFAAYLDAPADVTLAENNRRTIKDLLMKRHGFRLTEEDEVTFDHVFDVFAAYGPRLNYSSNLDGLGRVAALRAGPNNVAYADLMVVTDNNGVNRSYLSSEESFRFVKEMEQKNLVIPIVGNFGGPKAIRAVGTYLKEHDAVVGAFYLSNVEQYLFRPPQGGVSIHTQFYQNVGTLPLDALSVFIRSGNRQTGARGGLTPMMSPIQIILDDFKAGRIQGQSDVLNRSSN